MCQWACFLETYPSLLGLSREDLSADLLLFMNLIKAPLDEDDLIEIMTVSNNKVVDSAGAEGEVPLLIADLIREGLKFVTCILPLQIYYTPLELERFSEVSYRRIPVVAVTFDVQFPLQREAPVLCR
ncbi:hypothetical protein TNCV_3817371 [Trichonephila clavipes]|nr:hypothetical protein TNCV_3817371 [Trichonephila clavipes]